MGPGSLVIERVLKEKWQFEDNSHTLWVSSDHVEPGTYGHIQKPAPISCFSFEGVISYFHKVMFDHKYLEGMRLSQSYKR